MKKQSLHDFVVSSPISIRSILHKLNETGLGIVFVTTSDGTLIASVSDGDLRRMYLKNTDIDIEIDWSLREPPHTLSVDARPSEVFELLRRGYRYIPLVNSDGVVADIASRDQYRTVPISEPDLGDLELANLIECFESGWISSQGPFIQEFEEMFAKVTKSNYALAVSNGTVAIQLALTTLGIGPGAEVLVPDFTFGATINAVIAVGATPVLVDVDNELWTISISDLVAKINKNSRAIVPVHLYGQPAECNKIIDVAKQHNLVVVGDAAEALGATYMGCPIGPQFDAQTFSFFANKQITTGEGGMIVFSSHSSFAHAKILRDHGMDPQKRYWHEFAGYNYRMTNMQASIGVAQLKRFMSIQERRKEIFNMYDKAFDGVSQLSLLPNNDWSTNSNWLYTVRLLGESVVSRDRLIKHMESAGYGLRTAFHSLHKMPPFQKFANGTFPNSLALSQSLVSLPTSNQLTDLEITRISSELIEFLENDNGKF